MGLLRLVVQFKIVETTKVQEVQDALVSEVEDSIVRDVEDIIDEDVEEHNVKDNLIVLGGNDDVRMDSLRIIDKIKIVEAIDKIETVDLRDTNVVILKPGFTDQVKEVRGVTTDVVACVRKNDVVKDVIL